MTTETFFMNIDCDKVTNQASMKELAAILRQIADEIESGLIVGNSNTVYDSRGNNVGDCGFETESYTR